MSNTDSAAEARRKKLDLLEQARRRYIQMLYGYLPCLHVPGEVSIIHEVIDLIEHIAQVRSSLQGGNPISHVGMVALVPESERSDAPLTETEQSELRGLIGAYQIYVAKDPDTDELTMTHPMLVGIFHPLNEREVLDVARDIAAKAGGTV